MPYAVVTRDPEGAARYATALAPLGLEVIAMPVTRHEAPDDPDAVRRALGAGGFDAVMVASARAARALVATKLPLPPIWAIGPTTARILRDSGISDVRDPTVRDIEDLARELVAARAPSDRGWRVLVPRAEDGRVDGIAILRQANVEVVEVVAYRTLAVAADDPAIAQGRDLLVRGECSVCLVLAPSQVTALDAIGAIATLTTCFVAIGDTTGAALAQAGARDVVVAGEPTPEGVASALAAVYPRR